MISGLNLSHLDEIVERQWINEDRAENSEDPAEGGPGGRHRATFDAGEPAVVVNSSGNNGNLGWFQAISFSIVKNRPSLSLLLSHNMKHRVLLIVSVAKQMGLGITGNHKGCPLWSEAFLWPARNATQNRTLCRPSRALNLGRCQILGWLCQVKSPLER